MQPGHLKVYVTTLPCKILSRLYTWNQWIEPATSFS